MLRELVLAAFIQGPTQTHAGLQPGPCDAGAIPIDGFPLVSEVDRSLNETHISYRLEIAGGIAERKLNQLDVGMQTDKVLRVVSPRGWQGRAKHFKGRTYIVYWKAHDPIDLRSARVITGFAVVLPKGASTFWDYSLDFSDGTGIQSGLRGGCLSLGLGDDRGHHGD